MSSNPLDLVDDWDVDIIKSIPNWQSIAWSDEEAFTRYPKHNFVYDKLHVGMHHTDLKTYDLEKTMPQQYPVIVKPRVNLFGMGLNSYVASAPQEIEDFKGMIAQEISRGSHLTTDLLMKNGRILDTFTFECHKNFYGSFIYFESTNKYSVKVMSTVTKLLHDYTGVVCVEYIGDNIIDWHLRPASQFINISADIIPRSVDFLSTGNLKPGREDNKTYSLVYRTRYNSIISNKPQISPRQNGLRSVTYTYDTWYPLGNDANDTLTYRYMYLNGTDFKELTIVGDKIRQQLSVQRVK